MIRRRPTNVFLTAAVLFVMLGCGACSPDVRAEYRFKVIDAKSREPIRGAQVKVWAYGHYHGNRLFPGQEKYGPIATDGTGEVVVADVITTGGWEYTFDFEKPGYRALTVAGGPTIADSPWWFFSYKVGERLPSDDASVDHHSLSRDGENEIAMFRRDASHVCSAPSASPR